MASRIECDNGHRDYGTLREAARHISQNGALGKCPRCGATKRYIVSHYYPYDSIVAGRKVTAQYEVIRVWTRFSAAEAERQGWDPMIFLMRNLNSSEEVVWPYYWTKNRNKKWANGQFPPLLSIGELKRVINEFEK
jgi:hypothetical protein